MEETINCPSCGFPNMAEARTCMACQSPLPHRDAPKEGAATVSRLRPASNLNTPRSGPAPIPFRIDDSPKSPEEILERIKQVRGEDALKSLEMMAIPELEKAVRADLASRGAETPQVSSLPDIAQAHNPPAMPVRRSRSSAAPVDPWIVDHHEQRAVEVPDPWKVTQANYSKNVTPYPVRQPRKVVGFKPVELIAAVGILLLLVSLLLPWMAASGASEGQTLRPISLPLSWLVTGVSEKYPLSWLSVGAGVGVLAILAALALILPRSQLAGTALTVAGLMSILMPAAILVKLTISGEVGTESDLVYVADRGIYLALVASLVILVGAALRNPGSSDRRR